jgi:hypothetical protein
MVHSNLGKAEANGQTHGPVDFQIDLGFCLLNGSSSSRRIRTLCLFILRSDGTGINVIKLDGFGADNILKRRNVIFTVRDTYFRIAGT